MTVHIIQQGTYKTYNHKTLQHYYSTYISCILTNKSNLECVYSVLTNQMCSASLFTHGSKILTCAAIIDFPGAKQLHVTGVKLKSNQQSVFLFCFYLFFRFFSLAIAQLWGLSARVALVDLLYKPVQTALKNAGITTQVEGCFHLWSYFKHILRHNSLLC